MNASEEKVLRENIRHMIKLVKQKKAKKQDLEEDRLRDIVRQLADVEHTKLNEEQQLRGIVREFIKAELRFLAEAMPDDKPAPNKSTGINVLEDLLKKIIPQLEIDFRQLTTDEEQRKSYRAHIINAVIASLTPTELNTAAPAIAENLEEAVSIDIEPGDEEKFIDIRTDAEVAAEEDEEEEADPKEDFGAGLEDSDETGRNMAYQSFNKVEGPVIDSYDLLSNDNDQELFYDYLIANLKLYFDKFEGELSPTLEEPTNPEYEAAKEEEPAEGGEEEIEPAEGGEEELPPAPPTLEEVIVWDI